MTLDTEHAGKTAWRRIKRAREELGNSQREHAAFHWLGLMRVDPTPSSTNSVVQEWITRTIVPIALADRLALVAQPTDPVPSLEAYDATGIPNLN